VTRQPTASPSSEGIAAAALFAPGHAFFSRRIDLPEGLEPADERGFIELEIEKLSPFPIEHLNSGYKIDAARKKAFVYAAYRRRLENLAINRAERLDAALPDFVFALLLQRPPDRPLAIFGPEALTFATYDEASELPLLLRSVPRPVRGDESPEQAEEAPGPPEELRAARETFSEPYAPSEAAPRLLEFEPSPALSAQSMTFAVRDLESGERLAASVSRKVLWDLDVRDAETIAAARAAAQRNVALWRAALGLAAALGLLLMGELFWGLEAGYLALRRHWNGEQAPLVARIDDKQRAVAELQQFQQSDLAPFAMLVAIEPYRTSQIVFSRVETDGPNVLRIDATTRSVTLANQFRDRLRGVSQIASVNLVDMDNSAQGTAFTAVVEFTPGVFDSDRQEVARRG